MPEPFTLSPTPAPTPDPGTPVPEPPEVALFRNPLEYQNQYTPPAQPQQQDFNWGEVEERIFSRMRGEIDQQRGEVTNLAGQVADLVDILQQNRQPADPYAQPAPQRGRKSDDRLARIEQQLSEQKQEAQRNQQLQYYASVMQNALLRTGLRGDEVGVYRPDAARFRGDPAGEAIRYVDSLNVIATEAARKVTRWYSDRIGTPPPESPAGPAAPRIETQAPGGVTPIDSELKLKSMSGDEFDALTNLLAKRTARGEVLSPADLLG